MTEGVTRTNFFVRNPPLTFVLPLAFSAETIYETLRPPRAARHPSVIEEIAPRVLQVSDDRRTRALGVPRFERDDDGGVLFLVAQPPLGGDDAVLQLAPFG